MTFREVIASELRRRQERNRRYSLRRFAARLGVHHATISRLLRGTRPIPERTVRAIGDRLGLSAAHVDALVLAEHEAAVLLAIRQPAFRPASRWLATVSGLPLDSVNIAIQSLLRTGRLTMPARDRWIAGGMHG
jgi:transcriptional regulator with XRE-family HTH domain